MNLKADTDHKIDPDFFDVVIQSLSVLSSVATLATTWLSFKGNSRAKSDENAELVRSALRTVRRQLEDVFEAVENILRILEEGRAQELGKVDLLSETPKFGSAVFLSQGLLSQVHHQLSNLDMATMNARQTIRNIEMLLPSAAFGDMTDLRFDVDQFNEDLNEVLFKSRTFGDAMTKLRSVQRRAEDFVSDVYNRTRRN